MTTDSHRLSGLMPTTARPAPQAPAHDDIVYPETIPFLLVHLACFGAIWTGVTWQAALLGVVLYVVRMFGVTAGYHRYFSHRTFRTSRVAQFLLGWLAQTTAQLGILWWAAKHRHHHRHSDTELDVHSPRQHGFLYAHMGWIFTERHDATDVEAVPDLTKFPELVWLNAHPYLPALTLAAASWLIAGWPGVVVGFLWSTVALYHGTFMINSLAHVHGRVRYVTGDDSRNNWWLSIITLGEGWHNNHHAYQRSTRQGFFWWEFDPTFYALKALSWLRVVWDLGAPPPEVVRNERPLGRATIEKVAHQLAASFASVHLPQVPSVSDIRRRAEEMYAASPSMDEITARARELIAQQMQSLRGPEQATM